MKKTVFTILRIALSFVFLWAFFDKLFGLGFATPAARAWINGGSPTSGFLMNSAYGPFAGFFQSLAGLPVVDWLFMIGLLGIGISLLTGVLLRVGSLAGALMMVLMYLAAIPPENNPIVDDHIIYALILIYIYARSKRSSAPEPRLA